MIPRATLAPLVESFLRQAAAITGDVNMGLSITPQPDPVLATLMLAWKPNGDQELPSSQMVRHFQRDPDPTVTVETQLNAYLVITLAELERHTNRPTIH